MADCYFHGYSGGPGRCSECEAEDEAKERRGTRLGDNYAAEFVMDGPAGHPDSTVRSK